MLKLKFVWGEMSLFRRVMAVIMVLMILLFGVLTGVMRSREGVEYEKAFLRYTQDGDTAVYAGKVDGMDARFTVTGNTVTYQWGQYTYGPYRVDTDPDQKISAAIDGRYDPVTIWLDDVPVFRGGYRKSVLCDENGELLSGVSIVTHMSDGQILVDGRPVTPEEQHTPGPRIIFRMATGPELTRRASIGMYLLMTLCALINIVFILFPDFLFRRQFRFSVRNYEEIEPSDLTLSMRPFNWVLIGLLVLAGYWWNLTAIL